MPVDETKKAIFRDRGGRQNWLNALGVSSSQKNSTKTTEKKDGKKNEASTKKNGRKKW